MFPRQYFLDNEKFSQHLPFYNNSGRVEQRLPRASQRRTALGDGRLPVGSLEHVEVAAHHGQCLIRGGADQAGRGHDRNADSGDGCQATAARWPRPRLCPNVLTANAD